MTILCTAGDCVAPGLALDLKLYCENKSLTLNPFRLPYRIR